MAKIEHEYEVLRGFDKHGNPEHHVVVVYPDRPGWFQRVATFLSHDRAESYAEIEAGWASDDDYQQDDIKLRDDLPEAPASSLPKLVERARLADKHAASGTADSPPPAQRDTAPPETNSVVEAGGGDSSDFTDAPPAEISAEEEPAEEPEPASDEIPREERSGTACPAPSTIEGQNASEEGSVGVQPAAPHVAEALAVDLVGEGALPAIVEKRSGGAKALVEARLAATLQAIRDMTAEGGMISYKTVAAHTGIPMGSLFPFLDELKHRGVVAVVGRGQGISEEELRTKGGIRLVEALDTSPAPVEEAPVDRHDEPVSDSQTPLAIIDEALPPEPEILPPSSQDETPRADERGGVTPPTLEQLAADAEPETDLTPLVQSMIPQWRGLTETQATVFSVFLDAASADESLSFGKIAKRAGITAGGLGRIVDGLVDKGLLTRPRRGMVPTLTGIIPEIVPTVAAVKRPDRETPLRRFTEHPALRPDLVATLDAGHPAMVEKRTMFPSTVVDAADSPRLLIEGINQKKLGSRVTKGPWKGMPIFALTLEERATCPADCAQLGNCYGDAMPHSRRHRPDEGFFEKLEIEIAALNEAHPGGFVVRLHVLGDFFSVDYLACWDAWIGRYPALHVFGYTAHQLGTEMGDIIAFMRNGRWDRFAIRTSSPTPLPTGSTVIWYVPETPRVPEGIVCPAQTDRTDTCGTCGLCWSPAAKDETIAFVAHGRRSQSGEHPADRFAPPAAPQKALPAPDPQPEVVLRKTPEFKVPDGPLRPEPVFNRYGRPRKPPPPGTPMETVEEYLARGGQVKKEPPAFATGSGGGGIVAVTVRPKSGH